MWLAKVPPNSTAQHSTAQHSTAQHCTVLGSGPDAVLDRIAFSSLI
jgi:hypothetical protein